MPVLYDSDIPCLPLWGRWPSAARTERVITERACKAPSVACGDSSPGGRAKWEGLLPLPLGEVSEQSADGESKPCASKPSQPPAVTTLPDGEPMCRCYAGINPSASRKRRPLRMQRAALGFYLLGIYLSSVRKRWSITATWARVALFLADRVVRPLELTPVMIPLPTAHCIAVVA